MHPLCRCPVSSVKDALLGTVATFAFDGFAFINCSAAMKCRLLVALMVTGTLVHAEPPSSVIPKDDPPLKMDTVVVKGESVLSFGFAIRVTRVDEPKSFVSLIVARVQPGSDAEIKGLKPESRIVSINGKSVSDYEATFNPASELGRIFIGRSEGSSVILEVMPPGKLKAKKLKIYRRTAPYNPPKIGGMSFD